MSCFSQREFQATDASISTQPCQPSDMTVTQKACEQLIELTLQFLNTEELILKLRL